MIDAAARAHLSDDLIRRFGASLRGIQLYSPSHPIVARNLEGLAEALRALHEHEASVVIGILGNELIVGELPMTKASASMGELIRRFGAMGIERITIERNVTLEELETFAGKFGQLEKTYSGTELKEAAAQLECSTIRVGRVTLGERVPEEKTDSSTIRRMYADAVSVASMVWESARSDAKPDPVAAQSMIDALAQAVVHNRSALMALTALKDYDDYTFTHMVNVSILTMAQARGLGIDGPLLREIGLAALMHDIGKVKTPSEILN
jgi:HD-GYP domain-containing protein (c-di-GMP phosphodiesterase class II)